MKLKTNKEHDYNYFYKITNLLNGHFYYGIHSTNNLEDGYMGSGVRLNEAFNKFGIENFKKEIIKFFDSREELVNYEIENVTEELVNNPECYNAQCGGEFFNSIGTVSVKDKDGNCFRTSISDPRYLSGELVPVAKNTITVLDKTDNKWKAVPLEEFNNNKDRYLTKWKICKQCKDPETGKLIYIDRNDPDIDKYESYSKNKHLVKDKNGKCYIVDINDPRYLSGELVSFWKGRKHKPETKEKWKETYKRIKHQQGETNSQYGKVWIIKDGISKSVFKKDLQKYLNDGWKKGRKCNWSKSPGRPGRIWINNGEKTTMIDPEDLQKYLNDGWKKGRNINKY